MRAALVVLFVVLASLATAASAAPSREVEARLAAGRALLQSFRDRSDAHFADCVAHKAPAECARAFAERVPVDDLLLRDETAGHLLTSRNERERAACGIPEARRGEAPDWSPLRACLEIEAQVCLSDCVKRIDRLPLRGFLAVSRGAGGQIAYVLYAPQPGATLRVIARRFSGDEVLESIRIDAGDPLASATQPLDDTTGDTMGEVPRRTLDAIADTGPGPRSVEALVGRTHAIAPRSYALCRDRLLRPAFHLLGRHAQLAVDATNQLVWQYLYADPCAPGETVAVLGAGLHGLKPGSVRPAPLPDCATLPAMGTPGNEGYGCAVEWAGDLNGDGVPDVIARWSDAGGGARLLLLSQGHTLRVAGHTEWNQ